MATSNRPYAKKQQRLNEAREAVSPVEEMAGTLLERAAVGHVREDYSENGDAWNFFTTDHARSRAYRWRGRHRRPVR